MDKIIELQITELEDKLGDLRNALRDTSQPLSDATKAKLSFILADMLDDFYVLDSAEETLGEDDL